MKVHFIKRVIHFPDGLADSFHYELFHGEGERVGCIPPLEIYSIGDKLEYPLVISKNVFNLAHIIEPLDLVVSKVVVDRLKDIAEFRMLEVVFGKTYFYPALEYTFSHWSTIGDYNDQVRFIKTVPNDEGLKNFLPRYYEIITHKSHESAEMRKRCKIRFWVDHVQSAQKDVEINLEDLERFGIVWDSGYLLSDRVFNAIGELFHPTYFYHECAEA